MNNTFDSLARQLEPGDQIEVAWKDKRRQAEMYPSKGVVEWLGPRFIVYRTPRGWRCTVSKADIEAGVSVVTKKKRSTQLRLVRG